MRKLAGLFILLVLCSVGVRAQDAPPPETPSQDSAAQSTSSSSETTPDETKKPVKKSSAFSPKYEISAGFDHRSFGAAGAYKTGMNGWDGSFEYNWKRWLGFEGELQGVYATTYNPRAATEMQSIYTVLGGPVLFPFGHHKLSPFGHFLYGEGYYRQSFGPYGGIGSNLNTFFSHAWEGGGGLDYHIKSNWSVRGMFDYGSTHFGTNSNGSGGQGSYRVSVGVVYYIGKR
jgi:opacity protein-like surface antigen